MNFIGKAKAAMRFVSQQHWEDRAKWEEEDAIALRSFLKTETGERFKAILRNTVIQQQASAVASEKNLHSACGYANGQAGLVTIIEMMSTPDSISSVESDPTPDS